MKLGAVDSHCVTNLFCRRAVVPGKLLRPAEMRSSFSVVPSTVKILPQAACWVTHTQLLRCASEPAGVFHAILFNCNEFKGRHLVCQPQDTAVRDSKA
jgi:hypothetical protein